MHRHSIFPILGGGVRVSALPRTGCCRRQKWNWQNRVAFLRRSVPQGRRFSKYLGDISASHCPQRRRHKHLCRKPRWQWEEPFTPAPSTWAWPSSSTWDFRTSIVELVAGGVNISYCWKRSMRCAAATTGKHGDQAEDDQGWPEGPRGNHEYTPEQTN